MIIEKNNHVFHVTGRYSERWFKNDKLNNWNTNISYTKLL